MTTTPALNEPFHREGTALEFLLAQSELPIMAKFVAPHCSSCVTLSPILEQLVRENAGRIQLVEIDMVEDPEIAITHEVRSVPTLVLLKQNRELDRITGLKPKKKYAELVQKALVSG